MRTGPETYERKSDADRALVMVEAQSRSGDWTDPERGKVKLGDYGSAWITERPGLRPRTMDLYRWLLCKHIEPYLGGVPVGKLSTRQIREWRAALLSNGVSVSVAAKAYRLVRAILTTAVEDDTLLPRNPSTGQVRVAEASLTCGFALERVTGIEPALSAWASVTSGLLSSLTCGEGRPLITVRDPSLPELMAR
jgi:Phage integrase, N-terminal SAM-like domain